MFHTTPTHVHPASIDVDGWAPSAPPGTLEGLVARARSMGAALPHGVRRALDRFRSDPGRAGALLLRGLDLGPLPATPERPAPTSGTDLRPELALLTVACWLGEPVGYRPEHGGRVVQDIVPTPEGAVRQISTSSRVHLLFHTETAFHPHRPRYLLLLCLRGDPEAGTTLASAPELLAHLDESTVALLRQARYRTAVDASFLHGRPGRPGPQQPVLSGSSGNPVLVYDADLTAGVDREAERALGRLTELIGSCHTVVRLEPGDLLLIDNHRAVHGRTPFSPRYDGTDRWLQRSFVVEDLQPSTADRRGRVITTDFTA